MQIQIDAHTLLRAKERGTSEEEIYDIINTGISIPAKYGRKGKAKIFEYGNLRNGKYYKQKRVEVYYMVENDKIITVTAYVFYGIWQAK